MFVVWLVHYVCVSAVVCLMCAELRCCLLCGLLSVMYVCVCQPLFVGRVLSSSVVCCVAYYPLCLCVCVSRCLLCAEQKCCLLSVMSVCVSRCLLCGLLSVMCYVFVSRFLCVCAEQKCCLSSVMSVCVSVVVCLLCA